jgi:hypothetical protein
MAQTVADIIASFLDRINQPRESSYVGNTSPAARQYVSLFKFVADELLNYQDGWDQLKRTYTFTTSTGVANYQLPGDFLRMLTGTQWGVTNQIPLAGPLSNARLAFQTYGVNIATPYAGYQVNGAQGYIFNTSPYSQQSAGYFQISPPGQDNTTQNTIAYVSSNYVWPQNWLPSTPYVVGNIRTGVNNMYYCTVSGTSGTTRLSALSGTITDGTCSWVPFSEPYFQADTDFVLLDDELFIEGLRWAWYQSKQQFQMADRIEAKWRNSVRAALGRQNGATVVSAAYDMQSTFDWPVVGVGSWSGTGGG